MNGASAEEKFEEGSPGEVEVSGQDPGKAEAFVKNDASCAEKNRGETPKVVIILGAPEEKA